MRMMFNLSEPDPWETNVSDDNCEEIQLLSQGLCGKQESVSHVWHSFAKGSSSNHQNICLLNSTVKEKPKLMFRCKTEAKGSSSNSQAVAEVKKSSSIATIRISRPKFFYETAGVPKSRKNSRITSATPNLRKRPWRFPSTYSVNEHYIKLANSNCVSPKRTGKRDNIQHQSCYRPTSRRLNNSQSFWDVLICPRKKKEDRVKERVLMRDRLGKRLIEYKDKWSVNLIKKTALTNLQIQNRSIHSFTNTSPR